MRIGLVGCGNMGSGMATQLLKNDCQLICYDSDSVALNKVQKKGARAAADYMELVEHAEIIILSLPNAQVVEAVMHEISLAVRPKTIILDTSTSEPTTSQTMSALGDAHSFSFIDGPVSGGPAAASAGTMTMLLGGSTEAISRLQPVLDILTAKSVIVGGSGAGHATKIANNMLCAANLVLVAEALRLGESAGVAAHALLEGINAGSGRSGVSEVNFPKWILNNTFDSGFTMGLMRKDVGLAVELARKLEIELEGFATIADIWLDKSTGVPDAADFNQITQYTQEGINGV